ncbi:importin-4-like [Drosophila bipectinata]|uniref:importin-4-like n=1 Tax=Drosophila bipectinata TaxID=42026 RepID=UPI001C89B8CC|nr:importin-4-like [Drosophila bipectinata]
MEMEIEANAVTGEQLIQEWNEVITSGENAVTTLDRQRLLPHFEKVLNTLLKMHKETQDTIEVQLIDQLDLRARGIEVLANIARYFEDYGHLLLPMAKEAHEYCLDQLNTFIKDRKLRAYLYDLLSSLVPILGEECASSLSAVMEHIGRDTVCGKKDLETASNLKAAALLLLKEYVDQIPKLFQKHLPDTLKHATRLLIDPGELVRIATVDCICSVLYAMDTLGYGEKLTEACGILLPLLAQAIRYDEESSVVVKVVVSLGEIFQKLKRNAIPGRAVADYIYKSIDLVLNDKVKCQSVLGAEMEDGADAAFANLYFEIPVMFAHFGGALCSDVYLEYFGRIYHHLGRLQSMIEPHGNKTFFGSVEECVIQLRTNVTPFFDFLYPLYLSGFIDPSAEQRQNAIFAMGELIFYTKSTVVLKAYPPLYLALVDRYDIETVPAVRDNVLGALGRMILRVPEGVPLNQMLPNLLSRLPMTRDYEENITMLKVFRLLYDEKRSQIENFVERMLEVVLLMVARNEVPKPEWRSKAIDFAFEIKPYFPISFDKISNMHPEVQTFLHSRRYFIW